MNLANKPIKELKQLRAKIDNELNKRQKKHPSNILTAKEMKLLVNALKPIIKGNKIKVRITPTINLPIFIGLCDAEEIDWRYCLGYGDLHQTLDDVVYEEINNNDKVLLMMNKFKKPISKLDEKIELLAKKYEIDDFDIFHAAYVIAIGDGEDVFWYMKSTTPG